MKIKIIAPPILLLILNFSSYCQSPIPNNVTVITGAGTPVSAPPNTAFVVDTYPTPITGRLSPGLWYTSGSKLEKLSSTGTAGATGATGATGSNGVTGRKEKRVLQEQTQILLGM